MRIQRPLELGGVLELADLKVFAGLLEHLLAVVGPESLGSVLAAVLEQDLLSTRVLRLVNRARFGDSRWKTVSKGVNRH